MITCKEDLINTYIYDDGGELRDAYFSIAEKFGFLVDEGDYNLGIISVMKDCKYVQDINSLELVRKCKKLTLSDLKPRTKVEYEKATESIFDLKDEFENKKLWLFDGHDSYINIETEGDLSYAHVHDCIFRKVDRPVEWWEDAVEYIRSLNHEATMVNRDGGVKKLYINGEFAEREARDLARIILEQEGE